MGQKILVVDDIKGVADTLGLILQTKGYVCQVAYSGEQALVMAENYVPDLLITDVIMPGGMNGYELADLFDVKYPECRILLNTANPDAILPRYRVLEKPIPMDFLLKEVAAILSSPKNQVA